jgi:hypothetical protein
VCIRIAARAMCCCRGWALGVLPEAEEDGHYTGRAIEEKLGGGSAWGRKEAWQVIGRQGAGSDPGSGEERTGGGRPHPLAAPDSGGRAGVSAVVHGAAEEGPLAMATGAGWRTCRGDQGGAGRSGV